MTIGVFDSGVGGLSVLQALEAALPGQSFIYAADSAHAPYGDRPADFIEARAVAVASFLIARGAKALVLACNTASVLAATRLRALHALPIVAMEPAIKPAALLTRTGVVLVLATTATVRSPAVARLCAAHAARARILLQPCPGLVELAEQGRFRDPATRALLQRFIAPGVAEGADTIVLGCTHYAFLADEIAAVAGPAVTLVEPSAAIARQLLRRLDAPAAETVSVLGGTCSGGEGQDRLDTRTSPTAYCTSGDPADLAAFLASIGRAGATVERLPDPRA